MIDMKLTNGQRLMILEPRNLQMLKEGLIVRSGDKTIGLTYTPDLPWLQEKLIQEMDSLTPDRRLATPADAVRLAETLSPPQTLSGVDVRMGLIESKDFDRLPRARRDAVVAFWRTYISELSKESQIEAPELLREGQ